MGGFLQELQTRSLTRFNTTEHERDYLLARGNSAGPLKKGAAQTRVRVSTYSPRCLHAAPRISLLYIQPPPGRLHCTGTAPQNCGLDLCRDRPQAAPWGQTSRIAPSGRGCDPLGRGTFLPP